MTAARRHLTLRTVAWRRRGERVLVLIGVLLPIPLFAASGLSLPLPATVERLAAALVPWAEAATSGNQLLARGPGGSIVRLGGEREEDRVSSAPGESAPVDAKPGRDGDRERNEPVEGGKSGPGAAAGGSPVENDGDDRGESPPAESGGTREKPPTQEPVKDDNAPREEPVRGEDPAPPAPPPPPPPPPAQPPPPPSPTDPGGVVDDTVDTVADEVDETVDDVVDVVDKILPGLGK